jgi:hypothetical protein
VRCYDDVMAFVAEHQDRKHRSGVIAARLNSTLSDSKSTIIS